MGGKRVRNFDTILRMTQAQVAQLKQSLNQLHQLCKDKSWLHFEMLSLHVKKAVEAWPIPAAGGMTSMAAGDGGNIPMDGWKDTSVDPSSNDN